MIVSYVRDGWVVGDERVLCVSCLGEMIMVSNIYGRQSW